MASSIAIVYTSNTRLVGYWVPKLPSVQPSVLLAILAGISNTSLDFLLTAGVAVVWWRSAVHETTLAQLHYIWNRGDWAGLKRIFNAFSSGFSVRKVMIATATISIAKIVNGPFLQRASHTGWGVSVTELPSWGWHLAQAVPDGWVGTVGDGYPSLVSSRLLQQTAQDWQAKVSIDLNDPNLFCDGFCAGNASGAGLTANCVSSSQFLDLSAPENENVVVFGIDFSRFNDKDDVPTLNLTVKFTPNVASSCNATIVTESCTIQSAISVYSLTANYTFIQDLLDIPTVLSLSKSPADSVFTKPGKAAGLLTGLEWIGYYYLHANATLHHNLTTNAYSYDTNGILANQYYELDKERYSSEASCAFQWRNATEDILKSLYQLSMRMALASSNGI